MATRENEAWGPQETARFVTAFTNGCRMWGIEVTPEVVAAYCLYAEELMIANQTVNLTAIHDPVEVAEKHFLDAISLFMVPVMADFPVAQLADVGTGAGLPGLALALCRGRWQVTLIESLAKRCAFLRQIQEKLPVDNVRVVTGRAETLGHDADYRENFDLVTARAVARLPVLVEYGLPFVKCGGFFLAFKGPGGEQEAREAKRAITVLGGRTEMIWDVRLPLSGDPRCLILIRKENPTPAGYPRRPGLPAKRPLG
ncbi:MAG: 16S rRNA (guanine(527)-N(7))-methyltransferase RsmG [Heliobacteriaceae bacterium]|nr:16S rRNA (guanine(527)-N(7))-methyltransferase RsmG [Heliobacteriaceae bacterium]